MKCVLRKKWRGWKSAEVAEPESTDNGELRKNVGEKPRNAADKSRGRTGQSSDCGKKTPA